MRDGPPRVELASSGRVDGQAGEADFVKPQGRAKDSHCHPTDVEEQLEQVCDTVNPVL